MVYKFSFQVTISFLCYLLSSFPLKNVNEHHKVEMTAKPTLVENLYSKLQNSGFKTPSFTSFTFAFEGYQKLKEEGKIQKELLTIIDFSLSSTQKRLWIIDMNSLEILTHSLVSHGRNSGDEFATSFSNQMNSFQSSLGFFATAETYQGKHGYSLRLDGMEPGINDLARSRAVVIHGADYVSESFIQKQGRLGRSHGCPALPVDETAQIIDLIKDKTCLFIYHPNAQYFKKSKVLA